MKRTLVDNSTSAAPVWRWDEPWLPGHWRPYAPVMPWDTTIAFWWRSLQSTSVGSQTLRADRTSSRRP
jgi:hypothetical protein